jgi:hypothetical protein
MTNVDTIIRADFRVRARVLIAIVLCTLLGVLAIVADDTYVDQLMALYPTAPQLAIVKIQRFVVVLASVTTLLAFGLAGVLGYLCFRVLRSGQYPPPAMKVLRDTPLQTGRSALLRALVGLLLAGLILGCGLGASMLLVRAASDLYHYRTAPRLQVRWVLGSMPNTTTRFRF